MHKSPRSYRCESGRTARIDDVDPVRRKIYPDHGAADFVTRKRMHCLSGSPHRARSHRVRRRWRVAVGGLANEHICGLRRACSPEAGL